MDSKQKTILLTGGTGFLGSHLIGRVLPKKYRVIALKRASSRLDRLRGIKHAQQVQWFNYEDGLEQCFQKYHIDGIVHLATLYGHKKDSYTDVVRTNLLLPLELLELGLKYGVKLFLNADTFFNERLGLPAKEKSYTSTKKLFLAIAKDVLLGKDIRFFNARIEQMYGPNDGDEKFVSSTLTSLLHNVPEIRFTAGMQKRDFIYVDDVADAFVAMLRHTTHCRNFEEFGLGTGKSTTIKTAVEYMQRLTKSTTQLRWSTLPYRKNEIMNSKATLTNNKKIGWHAKVSLETGLQKTIRFYSAL